MTAIANNKQAPRPPFRRLRAFAFDPMLSHSIDTAGINEITIKIPWEDRAGDGAAAGKLGVGPTDDYLEVVDVDPASQAFYAPVDLNDEYLLAQDGLPPSEGNPQFHQQMVYAVARTTIGHFEEALGRRALWSPRVYRKDGRIRDEPVQRLRIYPHALREANAYYSPLKKALLFGYFPASITDPGENLPGGMVFTCLSHDIVAHETTHALLDGLHRRFIEPSNVDVWALHEAFADLVALFQHFTYPDVLRHQLARTRGDLERQNRLAELAYQFGQATGRYGALRSALGKHDPETHEWIPEEPDPAKIVSVTEPHERGAILVAAVFDAFLTIYQRRTLDLVRIATGGTGVLAPGDLHPDLINRLAQEAAKTAGHMLHMCIRALDYCPPVDVTFGDYLRALITADKDYVADDQWDYRLAVIEAFRRRGIYPYNVRSLSVESLLWSQPDEEQQRAFDKVLGGPETLRRLAPDWGLTTDRQAIYKHCERAGALLHRRIRHSHEAGEADMPFLVLDQAGEARRAYYEKRGEPAFEVHSVRPARRIGLGSQPRTDLVVEITQRRRGYFDPQKQEEQDRREADWETPDFIFRGGATLLIDLESGQVRYCVYKRVGPEADDRLRRQRRFLTGPPDRSLRASYFGDPRKTYFENMAQAIEENTPFEIEPFALLHRSYDPKEVR
jgi:hypothetical protein